MFASRHQQAPCQIKFLMQTGQMRPLDFVFNGTCVVEARLIHPDEFVQISFDSHGSKQCRVCPINHVRGLPAHMVQGQHGTVHGQARIVHGQHAGGHRPHGIHGRTAQGSSVFMAQGQHAGGHRPIGIHRQETLLAVCPVCGDYTYNVHSKVCTCGYQLFSS